MNTPRRTPNWRDTLKPGDPVVIRWAGTNLPEEVHPFHSAHWDGLHVYIRCADGCSAYAIGVRPAKADNPEQK